MVGQRADELREMVDVDGELGDEVGREAVGVGG